MTSSFDNKTNKLKTEMWVEIVLMEKKNLIVQPIFTTYPYANQNTS